MIAYAPIRDVSFDTRFMDDFESAPKKVKKKINSLIEQSLDGQRLPNSMQAHQSELSDGLWIGYVNRSGQHWRVLFWHDEDNEAIILHRLLTHDEMDAYIGRKARL